MQTCYAFYLALEKGSVWNMCNSTDRRICSFEVHEDIIAKLKTINFIDNVNQRCGTICNEWDTDYFDGEQLIPLKNYLLELIDNYGENLKCGDNFFDFLKNLYLYVLYAIEHDTEIGFVL